MPFETTAPDIHQIAKNVIRTDDLTPVDDADEIMPNMEGVEPIEADFEPAPDQTEKIKVDGEEIEVPLSKLIEEGRKALQMNTAAERRLAEAKAIKEAALAETRKEPAVPKPDIADDLQNAPFDPEAARRVAQRLQNPGVTEADIRRVVAQENAVSRFKTEFADIVEDENSLMLAASLEQKARASGDSRSDVEVLFDVGKKVREWRASLAGQTKQEAKERLRDVNVAGARLETKQETRAKTPSEIIAEMALKRGQRIN